MPPLSFHSLPALPMEIVLLILYFWMGPQNIKVIDRTLGDDLKQKTPGIDRLQISYDCEYEKHAKSALPTILYKEFERIRQLSWLKDTKHFNDPYDFYWSHSVLFNISSHFPPIVPNPYSRPLTWKLSVVETHTTGRFRSPSPSPPLLPPSSPIPTNHPPPLTAPTIYQPPQPRTIKKPYHVAISPLLLPPKTILSNIPTHGLEHISLDFSATQFFALFDVRVPPFHRIPVDPDRYLYNAAVFLQHATRLTLVFGEKWRAGHAWYDLEDSEWGWRGRGRRRVCEMGVLVDEVLEAAWSGGFVQHLSQLNIEGDVQPWVREKWSRIMNQWAAVKGQGGSWWNVHVPQSVEPANREKENMQKWPPECRCAKKCWGFGCEIMVPIIEWPEAGEGGVVGGWDKESSELDLCWD